MRAFDDSSSRSGVGSLPQALTLLALGGLLALAFACVRNTRQRLRKSAVAHAPAPSVETWESEGGRPAPLADTSDPAASPTERTNG